MTTNDITPVLASIWDTISNPLVYPIITAFATSIIVGFLTYHFAIKRFYREKQYQNKLDRYLLMADKMSGFVEGASSPDSRKEFVDSYRTILLYGNANVIKSITNFLNLALSKDECRPKDDEGLKKFKNETKLCLKKVILEMRNDLKASGKLKKEDFDIFI